MKKLTILCDMDAIVAALHVPWYARYNELSGDDLCIERVTDWNTALFAKDKTLIFDVLQMPGLYESLPPIQPAIDCMADLKAEGHEIIIASHSPSPHAYGEKILWLKKYMPCINFDRETMLGYHKHRLRADVLVDDGPHNLRAYRAAWGQKPLLITPEYPYNANCGDVAVLVPDYKHMPEAWEQIKAHIRAYAESQ